MKKKRFIKLYIKIKFKKCFKFIFWGCFIYNKKGLYYIWKIETVKEKKVCIIELIKLNEAKEEENKLN